ncbi:MAG: hypothetical protein IKU29_09865 [Parabacteroides sp.]|nr:hypothetical protein [Parabacteroides sp.]
MASLSPEERLEYDQALKHYRDYNNTMHTQYRQGKEEGLAEGEAIGLAKGETKGIRQMLQNMQEMGMDITTMAKIAKLSEVEVTNILQE